MATVDYAHISLTEDGKPVITGTRMKVLMIAVEHRAGQDAAAIQRRFPYLTLGQVYSALAYYHDHQAEMDRRIEEGERREAEWRAQHEETPGRRKLRERGLLP